MADAKTRYLEPAFLGGHHFITQVFDYPDGKRNLTCTAKDAMFFPYGFLGVAFRRIPRGWRLDRSQKVISRGGSVLLSLVKRSKGRIK